MGSTLRSIKKEYLDLAKNLYYSSYTTFDLFEYLHTGHSLTVKYLPDNKLFFMHVDNSKPIYYKEVVIPEFNMEDGQILTVTIVDKEFTDKTTRKWIEYPTYEQIIGDKIVPTGYGLFNVNEYDILKGGTRTIPNHDRAALMIKEIVDEFRDSNKTVPDPNEVRLTQNSINNNF